MVLVGAILEDVGFVKVVEDCDDVASAFLCGICSHKIIVFLGAHVAVKGCPPWTFQLEGRDRSFRCWLNSALERYGDIRSMATEKV